MVPIYKKGDVMECGTYRGINLMEHAINVLERVVNKRLRESVDIVGMQFGFIEGKGITYAVWIVKQTQENMLERNNHLCLYILCICGLGESI